MAARAICRGPLYGEGVRLSVEHVFVQRDQLRLGVVQGEEDVLQGLCQPEALHLVALGGRDLQGTQSGRILYYLNLKGPLAPILLKVASKCQIPNTQVGLMLLQLEG